jgi:amidophosphoribosyltransferase
MQTLPGRLPSAMCAIPRRAKGQYAIRDVQPFFGEFSMGGAAIAHNGNIDQRRCLRRELIERGSIFQSSSDSECIIHLMARSYQKNIPERMEDALRRVEGAFSVVAMTRTKLMGVRDPLGVRPLVLGKIGDGWALSRKPVRLISSAPNSCAKSNRVRWSSSTAQGIDSHIPFESPTIALLHLRTCLFLAPRQHHWAGAQSMKPAARLAWNWRAKPLLRQIWSAPSRQWHACGHRVCP